ncbi:hypothetical protein F4553_001943 [Allocatelliglobosispora scoriae]|uniref:Uncharacterized protein n=1 Tax=Allocatelliglobosispora scoriae TaxID=643052 RepID=A0A841BJW8_9ACTN|nr:hypothetical protein [Allocatelliglobosispora scoriae]MBB5868564.1 hypothetical protein [Allocatelliglobosispora scoriae]
MRPRPDSTEPLFTGPGALLDWYPQRFAALPWVVAAGEFAPDLPHRDMSVRALEMYLLNQAGYAERDLIWAGIAGGARRSATAARCQVIAVGAAVKGLLGWRNRLHLRSPDDRADVDADLAYGLLRHLHDIDLGRRNIAGRLIGSATGYAQRRWNQHLHRPDPVDLTTDTSPEEAGPDGGLQAALHALALRLQQDTGTSTDRTDLELLAATRLDGQNMADVAARHGLTVEAAYKRRRRLESRLAALTGRVPAPAEQPTTPVSPCATASAAAAGGSSRRTADDPARCRPGLPPNPRPRNDALRHSGPPAESRRSAPT